MLGAILRNHGDLLGDRVLPRRLDDGAARVVIDLLAPKRAAPRGKLRGAA